MATEKLQNLSWEQMAQLSSQLRQELAAWNITQDQFKQAQAMQSQAIQNRQQQPTQWVGVVTNQQQPTQPTQPQQTPQPTQPQQTVQPTRTEPVRTEPARTEQVVTPQQERPSFEAQLDKAIEASSIAETRQRLIEARDRGQISAEQFKQYESYLGRKAAEASWFDRNANQMYDEIKRWDIVVWNDRNTAEFSIASDRARQVAFFSWMSSRELAYAMEQGILNKWSAVYNELMNSNPQLIRDAEKALAVNTLYSGRTQSLEDHLVNLTNQILQGFTWDVWDFKAVLSENPRVNEINTQLTSKKTELDELKDSIDNVYRDLEKQLSWTGATRAYIQARAARMSEDLVRSYNMKLNEYNSLAWELQNITENVKYDMSLQQQNQAQQMQALQFLFGTAQQELQFQRGLEAEERQFDRQMDTMQMQRDWQLQDMQTQQAWQLQTMGMQQAFSEQQQQAQFQQQREMFELQQQYAQRNIPTSVIETPQGQQLINTQTWETIRTFDSIQPMSWMIWTPLSRLWASWFWDIRHRANEFPWEAWARNNNPAWITWNANFEAWDKWTAARLKEEWINFSKWTARPAAEWWHYVTFDTLEDWLAAQRIIMEQTYRNSTVWQMLQSWVWTEEWPSYARQVAWWAWIDENTKVSELSEWQLAQLQLSKIQKESPWLFRMLSEWPQINPELAQYFDDLSQMSAKDRNAEFSENPQLRAMYADYMSTKLEEEEFDMNEYNNVRQVVFANQWIVDAAKTVVRDFGRSLEYMEATRFKLTPASVRLAQSYIPWTLSYNIQQEIESAKSNIWIDKLLEIKASWAWLWAVPQSQLETLQSVLWRLHVWRDLNSLRSDIQEAIQKYEDVIQRAAGENEFFAQQYPQFADVLWIWTKDDNLWWYTWQAWTVSMNPNDNLASQAVWFSSAIWTNMTPIYDTYMNVINKQDSNMVQIWELFKMFYPNN